MRRGPGGMRHGLAGLLAAEGVSLLGSRMSMLALPWFALVTTGSPAKTGLVAFAEMVPYVLACAAGGPALDRVGARRASILADAASALAVVSIPLLHATGSLHFGVLVGLVGAAGLLRGFGDTAKRVIFPQAVAAAGVSVTRATSVQDGLFRLSGLLGAPLAGVLIAAFGAPNVLLLDAATFALAAVVVATTVPRVEASTAAEEPYLRSLRAGLAFIMKAPLVRGVVLMLLATNLFDAAHSSVLAPVWARDVAGTAVALGVLSAAFGLGAVLGNVVFTVVAPRVPRFAAYAVGFLIGGAPRFFAPAVTDQLWPVYVVTFVAGFSIAGVNPILGALQYELVPEALRSRVLGLTTAVAWAGIPLGGLLGGWTVQLLGLRPSWLVFGGLYLLVTLIPFVRPAWREMDRPPPSRDRPPPSRDLAVVHPEMSDKSA
jgi:predicted MFS family arabinose efflux permease